MRRAKAFFFVCAGICLLALAYHLGATRATAQAPGNPIITGTSNVVVTANGNVYATPSNAPSYSQWVLAGNVFAGLPTPAKAESFGALKVRYR